MQVEADRDRGQSGRQSLQARMAQMESGVNDLTIQLATLMARLAGVESDLVALKTGVAIVETRLTGIENRQRHAESRRERIESRFSDFDFGVDRVQSDVVTLKDRVRCVELDLRELSGTLSRGARPGGDSDTLDPLSHAVSRAVGFKSS
jgi:chromosome segregation ATPase